MYRKFFFFKSLILISFLISLCSCQYQLVDASTRDESKKKTVADYADEIFPPKEVYASQGAYRKIKINWDVVDNAVDYQIYYSESPFDTFTQIAETTDTEYEIEATPGTNYYFCVVAVNFFGTKSPKSKIVLGSSLATPIITEIKDETATSFTVNWWMDNCNEDTYQNNTNFRKTTFKIYVYDKDKKLLSNYTKEVDGEKRSATIEDLFSSSKYWFQVEAKVDIYNEDGTLQDNKTEISDYTDKDSAHKLTPEKVTDFSVSQGTSIFPELSWKIPDMVWSKKDNVWELTPVYFTILRKPSGTSEEYTKIATIGSLPDTSIAKYKDNARYHFDCITNKVYDTKILTNNNPTEIDYITCESANPSDGESKKSYTPKSKITFVDKSSTRGIKYDYCIRSYPDFTSESNRYTDESSITTILTGWGISQPTLIVKEEYEKTGDVINKINVKFNESTFSNLNTEYKYMITRVRTEIVPEIETSIYFDDDFKSATDTFNDPGSTAEYYKYNLYILPKDSIRPADNTTIPTNYIERFESKKRVTVLDNINNLPIIDSFSVDDGYINKFIIECEKHDGVTYEIIAIPFVNGQEGNALTAIATFTNNKFELTKLKDNLNKDVNIKSGDAYRFMIRATSASGAFKEVSLDDVYYTLGTPEVIFDTYEYDSITVKWPKVQMAKVDVNTFIVNAEYQTSTCTEDTGEISNPSNTTISYDEDKQLYTCKISKPSGYNLSYISGKPINLKITAQSSKHNEEKTESTEVVRTLGPAEIQVKQSEQPQKNQTNFSWSPAVGAKKYLIYRVMYGDKEKTDANILGTDKLVVNTETLTVENDSDQENNGRSIVEYDPNESIYKYSLIDKQIDSTETYGYQLNQERIQWGYPIDYIILPLMENDNANSISFNYSNQVTTFNTSSLISYETDFIKNHKVERCTFGYGFNVHAAKSESGSRIKITWDKPNTVNKSVSIYRMPFNKSANYNYGSTWEKIATKDFDVNEYEDFIDQKKSHLAYVYAIQYDSTSDLVSSYRTSPLGLGMKEKNYDEKYTNANKNIEPSNKGYLFSITNVEAEPIDGEKSFRELISWNSTWDFEERALCPKSFDIQIKNKNLAYTKDWISIARVNISPKGEFTFDESFKLPVNNNYDIFINTNSIGEVTVEPDSFKNNETPIETNGLLKVLRDTRHYYSLNITDGREDANNKLIYDRQFEDESLYTYRNVTKTEVVKCVSVIIADALLQSSIPTYSGLFTNHATVIKPGVTGTFKIDHFGGVGSGDLCTWGFDSSYYKHRFTGGTCSADKVLLDSDFILYSIDSPSKKGILANKLFYLPSLDITVSHSSNLSSYSGVINFTAGAEGTSSETYNLIITYNSKPFVNIENNMDQYLNWFPYYLNNDMSSTPISEYVQTAGSKNNNVPYYNSPWWN